MKLKNIIPLLVAGASALSIAKTNASVVVTFAENPEAMNSSLTNTQVYDFNSLSTGVHNNVDWSGVGSFDQLKIMNADQFGGATDATHPNGTKYSVQGVGSAVTTTTLTLDNASGYFGFWWSAGDAANVLTFYKNGDLVAQFTTDSLINALDSSYSGNPKNRSLNYGEKYAFINFFGDAFTTWDTITFTNGSAGSGFESDNYTSRVSTYNPSTDGPNVPGVVVARVDGTTTTLVDKNAKGAALWGSAAGVPGAPLPPVSMIGVFGLAVLAKGRMGRSKKA
jgi:hypothetical protein